MTHEISFPGLGLDVTLNRVAFSILGKDIYWYGIIICFGFILGATYINWRAKSYGFTSDNVFDTILIAVPVSILCARAYYVIFEWGMYADNPSEIFKTWHGGLAIYGGIIGAVLSIVIYGKWKHLSILGMADCAAFGLLIGQCIGRWGNFVNAEAFGAQTDLPWRMVIDGAAGVHPTFFYESLWNFIGFLLLHLHGKKRRFAGEIFLEYIAWYGFGRMLIEGLRTDSLYLFGTGLRVSQVLAALSCIIAICFLVRGFRKHRTYAVATEIQMPETPTTTEEEQK